MPSLSHPSRILFIRTDRMGDVLMNLPAIRLLRQTFPKAWITLMLNESVSELFKNHPDIDEIISVSPEQIKRSFWYRRALVKKFKKIRFDIGIAANPDKYLHSLLFFSKIPHRVGYQRKWSFFLNIKKKTPDTEIQEHETEKNLGLAKLVSDKKWDGIICLPVNPASSAKLDELLRKNDLLSANLLVLHPGTSDPEKRWDEESYIKLCDKMSSDQNLKILLIGGEEEVEVSERIAAHVLKPVIDWTGRLSLPELTALFHRPQTKLLVSSDSGPAHIAWISGTPVVVFYAKNTVGSNPLKWGPLNSKSEIIFKPIREITVNEVLARVLKVLEKN